MNRYQYEVFNKISFSSAAKAGGNLEQLEVSTDSIKFIQNENYKILEYTLYISYQGIKKIEYLLGTQWYESDKNYVTVSFVNKFSKLRISFENDIVDPMEFDIEYVDADKAAYDAKMYRENIKEITKQINFKLLPGSDYLNVIFKKISNDYAYSKLELYYTATEDNDGYQLMGIFNIPENMYYHTFEKLSEGTYAIRLIQYDNNDVSLFTSDYTPFAVTSYSGSHKTYSLINKG